MTCWSLELLSLFNNLPTYKGAKVQVLKTTLSLEFYFASIMQKKTTPNKHLFNSFHLNGHTLEGHRSSQVQLEQFYRTVPHESTSQYSFVKRPRL